MKTTIVGIGHKSKAGKNTVARFMIEELGLRKIYCKEYSFAEPLKNFCQVHFGIRKDRKLLQLIGTDVYRNYVNQDIWVNLTKERIEEENPDVAIITDVRFKNEADYIIQNNGILIKVTRPGIKNVEHISETDLDNYPFHINIDNDKGKEELAIKVQTLMWRII